MRVFRQTEDVVRDDVNARFADFFQRHEDLILVEALVDVIANGFVGCFDPERQPPEAGPAKLVQHAVPDRVDARIRPDIEVVSPLDHPVADRLDVTGIEHEHLVSNFQVADAVLRDQRVDLGEDCGRAPHAIAVHRLACCRGLVSRSERRLDAAERAVIRAAERRVNRAVWLAIHVPEAMPVVRAIPVHGQKVPGQPGHLRVELSEQRTGCVETCRAAFVAISEPADLIEPRRRCAQCLDEVHERVQPFPCRDKIRRFFYERALGQRRDVASHEDQRMIGKKVLDRGRRSPGCRHVLRRC